MDQEQRAKPPTPTCATDELTGKEEQKKDGERVPNPATRDH